MNRKHNVEQTEPSTKDNILCGPIYVKLKMENLLMVVETGYCSLGDKKKLGRGQPTIVSGGCIILSILS